MNDRLLQFLEAEDLTSAQFADRLGINRSRISHILGGRNMPNYEFFSLFMQKFPNANIEWLISGKGKMYKDRIDDISFAADKSRFDENHIHRIGDEYVPSLFDDARPAENPINGSKQDNRAEKTNVKEIRKVVRITLFYSDGSFEEFYK